MDLEVKIACITWDVYVILNVSFFRMIASDTLGIVNVWDRRMNVFPCIELTTVSPSTINSIQISVDNQVSNSKVDKGSLCFLLICNRNRDSHLCGFWSYVGEP